MLPSDLWWRAVAGGIEADRATRDVLIEMRERVNRVMERSLPYPGGYSMNFTFYDRRWSIHSCGCASDAKFCDITWDLLSQTLAELDQEARDAAQ